MSDADLETFVDLASIWLLATSGLGWLAAVWAGRRIWQRRNREMTVKTAGNVTVELPVAVKQRLDALCDERGTKRHATIHHGLILLEAFQGAAKAGAKLVIRFGDGKEEELTLVPPPKKG